MRACIYRETGKIRVLCVLRVLGPGHIGHVGHMFFRYHNQIHILFNFSVVELAKPEYTTISRRVPLHGTEEPLHEAEEPLHGTEKGVQSYPVYFKGQESESVPFLY